MQQKILVFGKGSSWIKVFYYVITFFFILGNYEQTAKVTLDVKLR